MSTSNHLDRGRRFPLSFIISLPPAFYFALNLFGLVTLAAIVAFCVAMRWFCETAHLGEAARSWNVTTALFVVIYLIPLGLFYLAAAAAIVTGESFNIDLGPAGLILLPVFAIPLVHLFISTSRMKRGAETPNHLPPGPSDEYRA